MFVVFGVSELDQSSSDAQDNECIIADLSKEEAMQRMVQTTLSKAIFLIRSCSFNSSLTFA